MLALAVTNFLKFPPLRRFEQDKHFQNLAEGTYVPPAFALSVLGFSTSLNDLNLELKNAYLEFKREGEAILRGTGAYFLEYTSLAVPLAYPFTLHSRIEAAWSEKEKREYTAEWVEALQTCQLQAPLSLRLAPPHLTDSGEAFFPVQDTGLGSESIRRCVKDWQGRLPLAQTPGVFSIPPSLSMIFMRFALSRDAGVSEKDIEARWSRLSSLWANRTINIHSPVVFLVEGDTAVVLSSKTPWASLALTKSV